jgi:hypothetical protein
VSGDVEPDEGAAVPPAADAVVAAGAEHVMTFEEGVEEQLQAERSLWRTVVIGMVIATPICIAIWLAIVALAVGGNSDVSWGLWLSIGAVIGLIAGAFFGGLFAFVTNSHVLDDTDRHAAAAKHEHMLGHH